MTPARRSWFEDDAGSAIRPYSVVGGRSGERRFELDMITIVATTRTDRGLGRMQPEHNTILRLCSPAMSVAEVAAHLRLPLTVTKILIGDLIHDGYLSYRKPAQEKDSSQDTQLLRAVLDGIRRI
ncbi:DUF742 domain-containing protein [Nocardia sp. NPDC005366]|uniref:DUF742 domain-containing protein n=1 Tax=Nocardia sp. NPDC005366 TaxID=3156878 RepID=UPI0033A8A8EC